MLLDQEDTSVQKSNTGTVAKQTLESVSQNNVKSAAIESTLLSQLDCIARSPHLCQEDDLGTDAFGLRDMHCMVPSFKHITQSSGTDTNLLNESPSTGLSFQNIAPCYDGPFQEDISLPGVQNIPPCYGDPFQEDTSLPGVQNIVRCYTGPFQQDSSLPNTVPCYNDPFQQDTSLPMHNAYFDTTTTSSNTTSYSSYLKLSSVEQKFDQLAVSLSSKDPSVTKNQLQSVSNAKHSTIPQEHSTCKRIVGNKNIVPFIPPDTTDGSKEIQEYKKGSMFQSHRQLFPSDISPPLANSDIPDTESHVSSAGTIGETKPIGFVPAVKGTTVKNELETAVDVETVGQDGQVSSRLTTMARIQPSSMVKPQQQAATTDTNDSQAPRHSETGEECKTTENSTRPPVMPCYPAPWTMPPYPGRGPFPYPFYPPWPYCPPMPMMPMMPHPMMQMVPMPCWMPPMHPAMRMRPPIMATASAGDANDKTELVTETKP